jgi:hypothetical protein
VYVSGCVALISSGGGAAPSVFVDASVSGGDVFFITAQQLVPADIDPATDMYDAHVCSAAVPCLPASAVASPPCDSTDSCRAAQAVQPGVFGAPASATFSGAGNLKVVTVKVPPKPLTPQQQRLKKALKACEKHKALKARASCEKRALKKFGAHKGKKPNKKAKRSNNHGRTKR